MGKDIDNGERLRIFSSLSRQLALIAWLAVIGMGVCLMLLLEGSPGEDSTAGRAMVHEQNIGPEGKSSPPKITSQAIYWTAPDTTDLSANRDAAMIQYGKELIVNTSKYFGAQGKIGRLANNMNCQNCHLEAGTKAFANNFSVFFSSYPKLSERSGRTEEAFERIEECFERSMNGTAPGKDSKEMLAMLAYMKWVGKKQHDVKVLSDNSVKKPEYMPHEADPLKGKLVYQQKCSSCHSSEGSGTLNASGNGYIYPPLWGAESYNDGAGMYRLINFAGFVKNNMPLGTTYQAPVLSDEEAWNVAAYVNSRPRPHFDQRNDYKKLSTKPLDYPFGPYADGFSASQHKFGPFIEIAKQQQLKQKK
ncbi:c-type cytochrome [Pedobacter suwonensis]|uniref:c-type cytochrome n=1 Tax=Pedobacter suwonensis TaxID=332999 RepID=UPI0036CB2D19